MVQLVNREAHLRAAGVTGLKPAGGRVIGQTGRLHEGPDLY